MRAALYARYSIENQRDASIEDQTAALPLTRRTRGLGDRRQLFGRCRVRCLAAAAQNSGTNEGRSRWSARSDPH